VVGLGVAALVLWAAAGAWGWYDGALRPHARSVAAAAPRRPPTARRDDPAAARRLQETTDRLGEAGAYLVAGEYDWARAALARVLARDPGNADAAVLLAQVEAAARRGLPADEAARRAAATRATELVGAACTLLDAGRPAAARTLLEEALALEPGHPSARAAWAQLPPLPPTS
jgi:predicted Zn-dependent protease